VGKKAGKGMLGESKSNEMEAALVRLQVRKLVEAGVKADDIAVITPYNFTSLSYTIYTEVHLRKLTQQSLP
jgi:hypothetical protein